MNTRESAFHGTNFGEYLHERGIDLLIVAGVSTHACVAATAIDAYAHNLHVVLAEDAIASPREHLHAPTLNMLCDEFRIKRLTMSEIITMPEDKLTERQP